MLTTHNPLFVDRSEIRSNIIVQNNRARSAKNVEEIRDVLGVRASDNLRHAELVLIVEGEEDRIGLTAIISHLSRPIARALEEGNLAVDSLGGATNLAYKLGLLRDALCQSHVFLDNDAAGRRAFETAKTQGLVSDAEAHFATALGKRESELEDLYDAAAYATVLMNRYGVSIKVPAFRSKKRWSKRMQETFLKNGKPWSEKTEKSVKEDIANLVATNPRRALLASAREPIDALVATLKRRLKDSRAT